jgi:hypothetical protein
MSQEIFFINHDNPAALVLSEGTVAVDLSNVTRMTLSLGTVLIESTNSSVDLIKWKVAGSTTGEIRVMAGLATVAAEGYYDAPLVVYDTSYVNGIVWGTVPVRIYNDPEAAS